MEKIHTCPEIGFILFDDVIFITKIHISISLRKKIKLKKTDFLSQEQKKKTTKIQLGRHIIVILKNLHGK